MGKSVSDTSNLNRGLPFSDSRASGIFISALGELHYSYTALEHELTCAVFVVAVHSAGRNDDVIIALLGGQRMKQLKETIKRLLRATKADPDRLAYVDAIFLQLGEIQFFRDRLTHFLTVMSDYDPECWVNMNHTGVRERGKMEDIHFNLFALKAASMDLLWMRGATSSFFSHHRETDPPPPELPTWQYKPSMLVRDHPRPKRSRRERALPRPPSNG